MTTKLIVPVLFAGLIGCTTTYRDEVTDVSDTYTTVYDCGDDMGCTIPSERFTQEVNEGAAITTALVTIPNRNGSNMVALASADEMGIVQLKPRVSNFTSNVNLYVSAGSPFIGHIEGPIDVFPLFTNTVTVAPRPILDIISFETQPPQAPFRAVMLKTVAATLDVSGVWLTGISWKVTGRKRVRVTMRSSGAHTFTSAIIATAFDPTGGTVTLDTKSISAVSQAYADFSTTALYNTGATLPPPGVHTIDYINVNAITAGTNADVVYITLEAWDT